MARTPIRLVNPGPSPGSNKAVVRATLPAADRSHGTECRRRFRKGIVTPWKPPGIAGPWPADEYLWDGGEKYPVIVDENLDIKGLALEDTLVHYDTIDGRTIVEPSNRVVIYSPRFGAVRQVTSAVGSHQDQVAGSADQPARPDLACRTIKLPRTALQPVQPVGEIGTKQLSIEKGTADSVATFQLACGRPRCRIICCRSKIGKSSATACSRNRNRPKSTSASKRPSPGPPIRRCKSFIDKQYASVETGDQRAQATFMVETPNHPRLRVIKLASTHDGPAGRLVDFTIRFDNIGDQMIGNVTLVDNLTTRLEYVDGSAESSLAADFFTNPNEGDSLLLRWEFVEPLRAGQGGVVRFRCRGALEWQASAGASTGTICTAGFRVPGEQWVKSSFARHLRPPWPCQPADFGLV